MLKEITNFIFELNQLKKQKHNGFMLAGVENPDSVAEHALRAAQIGYLLAVMENYPEPEKVACILMVHDNAEARIGDRNKVSARYLDTKDAESRAFEEQTPNLEKIKTAWINYFTEFEDRNTQAGVIAKDADWLEQAFQAKEYVDLGYSSAQDWINNVSRALETDSAKQLMAELKETKFTDWWKGLKKMTYTKLENSSKIDLTE